MGWASLLNGQSARLLRLRGLADRALEVGEPPFHWRRVQRRASHLPTRHRASAPWLWTPSRHQLYSRAARERDRRRKPTRQVLHSMSYPRLHHSFCSSPLVRWVTSSMSGDQRTESGPKDHLFGSITHQHPPRSGITCGQIHSRKPPKVPSWEGRLIGWGLGPSLGVWLGLGIFAASSGSR